MPRILSSAVLLLAAASLSAQSSGVTVYARSYGTISYGNYYNNSFSQPNSGGALGGTSNDPLSSYNFSAGFSSQTAYASGSYTNSTHQGEGFANMISFDPVMVTPVNPVLANTGCQLHITYHVSGTVTSDTMASNPYYPFAGVTFPSTNQIEFSGVSGMPTGSLMYVDTINSGFNSTTTLRLNATVNTLVGTVGANGATVGTAQISVSRAAIEVWVNGAPVAASTSGSGGSTFCNPVDAGGSLATTLVNTGTGSLGTTFKIAGTAGTATTLTGAFQEMSGGVPAASDFIEVRGSGGRAHYKELSYDQAIAMQLFGTDATLRLMTQKADGTFVNTVDLNGPGSVSLLIPGAYPGDFDQATLDARLGWHGLDTVNHTVWAIVDHDSVYVASVPVPEPTLLLVLAACLIRRRR